MTRATHDPTKLLLTQGSAEVYAGSVSPPYPEGPVSFWIGDDGDLENEFSRLRILDPIDWKERLNRDGKCIVNHFDVAIIEAGGKKR